MSIDPHRLRRLVWGTVPGVVCCGRLAIDRFEAGAYWGALSAIVVACVMVFSVLHLPAGRLNGRRGTLLFVILLGGLTAWLFASHPALRVVGFTSVVIVHVVAVVLARRSLLTFTPESSEQPTVLNLHSA